MHCSSPSIASGHRFLHGRRLPIGGRVIYLRPIIATRALFGFGKKPLRTDSEGAGMVGSQGRNEFCYDDVEQYFNYMGMLAEDGDYSRMQRYLDSGIDYIDILLLWASAEGDDPKVEELLKAGARVNVKDLDGRSPMELAGNARVKELLEEFGTQTSDA